LKELCSITRPIPFKLRIFVLYRLPIVRFVELDKKLAFGSSRELCSIELL
jgi:hypothetical protein